MRKFYLFILTSLFSVLILSCQGTREQELKKLDKLWGYCDNPHREFSELEYNTPAKEKKWQNDRMMRTWSLLALLI